MSGRPRRSARRLARKLREENHEKVLDLSSEETDVARIVSSVRRLIWIIAFILPVWFAWIQLSTFDYYNVIETISPHAVRQIGLAVYYLCWIQGAPFDLRIQELVLVSGRKSKKLSISDVALILLFGTVTAILLWASRDDKRFAVALLIFFAANIVGFMYILWFVKPLFTRSKNDLRLDRKYASLLRLAFVEQYMYGRWQWIRFSSGLIIIVGILLVSFSAIARTRSAVYVAALISAPDLRIAIGPLIPNLLFVFFLVVMEVWIWLMRLRVRIQLGVVGEIIKDYEVTPRIV